MGRVHLVNFVRTMTLVTAVFLAPLRFVGLGFSGLAIGVIVALLASAPIVFAFPTGWLNDRFSMKKVIGAGLLGMALAIAAAAVVRTVAPMAAAFLLLGVANNAVNVSVYSLYYKDEGEPDTNRKYGRFVGWLSLGPPAGLVAGSLLVRAIGLQAFLGVLAAVTALVALAVPG